MSSHFKQNLNQQDILKIDREHIWHPYSRINNDAPLYCVKEAQGCEIILHDGTRLIDGMASWWSVIHGYNHPRLNRAAEKQIASFSHVMFGGLTHEPAAQLASRLVQLTPPGLDKIFFCDSGSVAIEVAMKMALQYWVAKGQKKKSRFISFLKGYHGDTFKAMSVCDPVTGMHTLFKENLEQQIFSEAPRCKYSQQWDESYIEDFKNKISSYADEVAAVVLEPIVQGAGGMRFYSPHFLARVKELCETHNVLLIADEIATGLGRTGKLFACEHAGISPDILCLGKTLTAGYLSFGATLCTSEIAEGIAEAVPGVFMHGPTYMGNPLACAVAAENIDILLEKNWLADISRIEKGLLKGLSPAAEIQGVEDVRILGAIGVIELSNTIALEKIQPALVNEGIWLRPFGNLVYTMPPYIINNQQLSHLCEATVKTLRSLLA